MTERKFNIPLIIMSAVALGLWFFGLPGESIVLAVITIIASVKLRSRYLIKIPIALSILAILISTAFLTFMIVHESRGISSTDYWLMRLIFGRMK